MRIGLLFDHWDPARGGAEAATAALVRHLITAGHEVHVFGLTVGEYAAGEFHALEVRSRRRGELERELAERSLDAADSLGCDRTLAIRHTPRVDVYWPHGGTHVETLAARRRARARGLVGKARNLLPQGARHAEFLALEAELLAGGAGRVWCVSEMICEELAFHYPDSTVPTEVHANGVDPDRFHPSLRDERRERVLRDLGLAADRPVLLFLGGNWELKGFRVLLQALPALQGAWQCLAVGRDTAWASVQVAAAGLRERVRLIERREPRDLYAVADLLVQPTYRDPCSLATLEALASGVPIVTTTANGAAEALRDDYAGSVVSPDDPDHLWEALRAWLPVVADPAARARSADAARAQTDDRRYVDWLDGMVAAMERA